MKRTATKLTTVFCAGLVLALAAAPAAEARRGGSFGSRGARTYQPVQATRTAPQATAPVQRSMTAPPQAAAPRPTAATPQAPAARRGGFLGGMGGGLLGGLLAGGLLGMMLGHGWGGMGAGFGSALLQIAIIAGGAWLLMSFLRRRRAATADVGGPARHAADYSYGGGAPFGGGAAAREPSGGYVSQSPVSEDIGLVQSDRDAFERLLGEVQHAFAREDYAALRAVTTPEVMSYLSEELSQNAVAGRRNDVSGTRLLQADVAEAWREDDTDYATAALRYESVDVMRDRQTGAIVQGDPARPSETTELWTFVRRPGDDWKLSAIQEA